MWRHASFWPAHAAKPTHATRCATPASLSQPPHRAAPGRLINRFTKDTEAVDTQLSAAVNSALSCLVSAALAIVVVVGVVPFTLLVLVPLAFLYYRFVCVLGG